MTNTQFIRPGIETGRHQRQQNFNNWMRDKIKNIYYTNNARMVNAFERVE